MEKKIESGVLAKIFGLYIGCEIKCTGGHFIANSNSKNENGELILSPSILADCYEKTFNYSDFKLLLTPLSEITDEDAIEVGKMCRIRSNDEKELAYTGIMIPLFHLDNYTWDNNHLYDNARTRSLIADLRPRYMLKVIDFLRFNRYALPYMGIDLFDAGIAIPKTKKI